MGTWVGSVEELVAPVTDGAGIALGGVLFTRLPIAQIRAVCAAKPRNLHYITWGGGLPLEMLLEAGTVSRATMCFSSLDIFGPAPQFRHAVEAGQLELVELTAHAMCQALSAGGRRLPSEPFTWPTGSDLVQLPGFPPPYADPITGERIGAVSALRPDVLLLHAPAADEDGNFEIVGARGMDLLAIPAAKQVLVTVEKIVPREQLGRHKGSVVVSRHHTSAIAVAPGGAAPTSCLPYYLSDYDALLNWTRADSMIAPAPTVASRQMIELRSASADDILAAAASHQSSWAGSAVEPVPEPTVDEWMVCWLARQYDNDSICSVGAVSPLAAASYLLAKRTSAPGLTLLTNGGCYIDVASRPVLLGLGEWLDATSAVTLMGGEESYEWFYQSGMVSHEVVSVAQIDATGRTNNWMVRSPSGRDIRLRGQGGMADVADMHQNFLVYLPRQPCVSGSDEASGS